MMKREFDNFSRIVEIANMFSLITGKTFDESFDLILSTKYGQGIFYNNPTVMYQQTTENLRAIAEELNQRNPNLKLKELFTADKIFETYMHGNFSGISTARTNFPVIKNLKEKHRMLLKNARKKLLNQNKNFILEDRQKDDL